MEAPEKIYLYPSDRAGYEWDEEWADKPLDEDSVEYIRTDAFIDEVTDAFIGKACEYISCHQCEYIDFDDFKKYMEGE